jgi:PiT family inorganic phosphate transporter
MTVAVLLIIGVALLFDYINGFHDAANSIATVVSTRVLTPKQAVAWAAFFNFAAFIFFGTKVAETISQVARPGTFTNASIVAALDGPADLLIPRARGRARRRGGRIGGVELTQLR